MTTNHDHDAFELRFEQAVDNAHNRTERGNAASPRAWEQIRAGITSTDSRAETADPRAIGRDLTVDQSTTERNSAMDATLAPTPGGYSLPKPQRFGWMALIAASLVGVMIVTTLWTNGGSPPPTGHDNLAWAPGMASPESTPIATTGACTVEPLTTDQVMETVLNPNNGYLRLGTPRIPKSDSFWEPEEGYLLNSLPVGPRNKAEAEVEAEHPMFDPATEDAATELEAVSNEFWTCLTEGSAFQVWGILDPVLVQQIILNNFPVIRSENDLRTYIETQGPRLFKDTNAARFSSISQFAFADNAEFVEGFVTERELVGLDNARFARLHFESPEEPGFVYKLYVRELSPGVWVIYEISPQPA